jgi:5-methylcytosine-specific restriction endonuclease McrBC regulatory subunit McrC
VTYQIAESQTLSLSLSSAQVAAVNALAAELRSHSEFWGRGDETADLESSGPLSCTPGAGEKSNLIVRNAVGLIAIDDVHITIAPKIPQAHFMHLLDVVRPLPRQSRQGARAGEGELTHLVASWLVDAVIDVLRSGLRRDYRATEDEVVYVRGSIRPEATLARFYRGSIDVSCNFDEHDNDGPLNRVLKAALVATTRMPLLHELTRSQSRRALAHFTDVSEMRPQDLRAVVDRTTHHYSEALDLARLVLAGAGLDIIAGGTRARCFLFPTASIIEGAIRKLLATHFHGGSVVRKRTLRLSGSYLTVTPDLVFEESNAIGDVKYKIGTGQWDRGDLYQSVAFASAFEVTGGAVISFRPDAVKEPTVARFGPISITSLSWPIGDAFTPQLAESTLISSVSAWLQSA